MCTVLVIEDNQEINQLLSDDLSSNYQVLSAYSGTEGLLLFKTEKIDLVLLDIMLPGKNGGEVLKEIRSQSQVPIIMISALDQKKVVSEYLIQGANDYIVKPFDLDEVRARIIVQLRNGQVVQPNKLATLIVGKLQLNQESFTLSNSHKEVRLSKKEFDIFKLLLDNPQRIFTKEALYESIWNETYFSTDNSLNTHLSNLRKKIVQLDETEEYIETVWGLGVRLNQVDQ